MGRLYADEQFPYEVVEHWEHPRMDMSNNTQELE